METFKWKYTERDRQGDKIIKIQTEKYTERDKQRESEKEKRQKEMDNKSSINRDKIIEKEKDRKRWTTRAL